MSARNVSARQLEMFMTPHELTKLHLTDATAMGGYDRMARVKQIENERSGLDEAIKKEGVQKPVNIYHTSQAEGGQVEMTDGHHRLVAALKHHPDSLIPVVHHSDEDLGKGTFYSPSNNDWAIRKRVAVKEEDW